MEIELTLKNYRVFSDSQPATIRLRDGFTGLIGANNAGKSSMLKFLYEFRNILSALSSPNKGSALAALRGVQPANFLGVRDTLEVFCNQNNRDLTVEVQVIDPELDPNTSLPEVNRAVIRVSRAEGWTLQLAVGSRYLDFTMPELLQGAILRDKGTPTARAERLFSAMQLLSKALYIGPFRNAINVSTEQDYFDIQVGTGLIHRWRDMKTGPIKSQNERAFQLTKDIQKIFGYRSFEINSAPDNQTFQVFIDGRSYRLEELGSGIAQFILVLANIAVKEPSLILIDEPELNLHPSLQVDFLTTLGSYALSGVVFATHSIGLARSAAEWIYSVRRTASGASEVRDLESTPCLSEFLGELGFSSYRELGYDKVLMVEGTTDLTAVQQFLRLLGKEHQVLLLPLGGSQMINDVAESALAEVRRISDSVSLLIDSERPSVDAPLEAKRAAFVKVCEKLGMPCHVLTRRALENYLCDSAIKRVKGPKYRALAPYELLKSADPSWSKSENWRIAREMTLDDLNGTDLGEFLKSL